MDLSPKKPKQYICRDWVRNLDFCELGDRPLDLVDKKKKDKRSLLDKNILRFCLRRLTLC